MKLGFLSRYPWSMQFGGAELQAAQYIDGLKSLGCEAGFIDFYDRSLDVDIVHCVGLNWETETLLKSARRLGKKAVVSPVFYVDGKTERLWHVIARLSRYRINGLVKLRNALLEADVILPNSNEEARQIARLFNIPGSRFRVVHNGVDLNYFSPSENLSQESEKIILSVAMIDERKNTLGLIKAFQRSGLPHKLVIVGSIRSVSGAYAQQIKNLVAGNQQIQIVEFMDRGVVRSLYQQAVAHVLPSKLETPGLSTLEAMACGVPCVVGDCAPVREYFGDAVVYAQHSSEASIVNSLQQVVSANWDRNTLRAAVGRYAWPSITKQLHEVYCDVLAR